MSGLDLDRRKVRHEYVCTSSSLPRQNYTWIWCNDGEDSMHKRSQPHPEYFHEEKGKRDSRGIEENVRYMYSGRNGWTETALRSTVDSIV